jgi:UDP-3-O-[3-hydroxymyristoyl] glucosamine N-acyltransferase
MKRFLNKICLIGAGAFSYQLLQDINNYKHKIFFNQKNIYLNSFYTLDSRDLVINKNHLYLITVANPKIKENIFQQFKNANFLDYIFIDSSISKKIKYKKNLIVWRSFIGDNVEIDNNVYIGPYSIIAKGTVIEKNVSIYPRVSILKKSYISENVIIGTNSVITDGVNIGKNSIIGPNTTIWNNVPDNSIII